MAFHGRALEQLHRLFSPERLHEELARVAAACPDYARDAGRDGLSRFSREAGLDVPASLAAWYADPRAVRLLRLFSNEDYPLYPEEFVHLEDEGRRLVQIMSENQGACIWAVPFDGAEDPPVLVRYDAPGRPWREYAGSFSAFVSSAVLDWGFPLAAADVYRGEQEATDVEPSRIDALLSDHERGPIGIEASGDRTVRYVAAESYVRLTGRSHWLVAGLSFDAFDRVMDRLGLSPAG